MEPLKQAALTQQAQILVCIPRPLSASNIIFHGHALENLKCHLIDLNGREAAVTG